MEVEFLARSRAVRNIFLDGLGGSEDSQTEQDRDWQPRPGHEVILRYIFGLVDFPLYRFIPPQLLL